MTDEQVVALYDDALEMAGGEDQYVPGEDELVPIRDESPLAVWAPEDDAGSQGRDPWDWSVSGPRENESGDVTSEELREIREDIEGPVLVTSADDEADRLVRSRNVAPRYVDPPMYGSWEAL